MISKSGGSGESTFPRLAPKAAERLLKPALGGGQCQRCRQTAYVSASTVPIRQMRSSAIVP